MTKKRKTIKSKEDSQNVYVSKIIVRVIDTYEKNINKELTKYSNKKVKKSTASEILGKILQKEPNLLDKHSDVLRLYVRGYKK